ncbi:MAG: hypothetical protein J7L47_06830 [Candidatus Odinarchaeota archaeon]|nr:hypothetical protein [Candidatus Odinarchaeota archaeon]
MSERILKRLDRIEKLLLELNLKIENFMGFEELSEEEKLEVEQIEKEVSEGKYKTFDEVFSD